VGFWDAVRGRQPAKRPNLDNLFAVPGAAITLQTALGILPTGVGSVCFRAAEGPASADAAAVATALVEEDGPVVERSVDDFGFTWLVVRHDSADVGGLVTDLHAVNTELEMQGFSTGLLCSVVGFTAGQRSLGLVYLYKQGTFYPFAPTGAQARETLLERQVRDVLAHDLPVEPEAARWLPLWGAPGL
jgi:hypothetical protein